MPDPFEDGGLALRGETRLVALTLGVIDGHWIVGGSKSLSIGSSGVGFSSSSPQNRWTASRMATARRVTSGRARGRINVATAWLPARRCS